MSVLRGKILLTIYSQFEQWLDSNARRFACQKGCATCCTQNVTMTAVEGDLIHRFINDHGRQSWFAEKLQGVEPRQQVLETTNEFAEKCLAGKESSGLGLQASEARCPFLENDICQIYQARPFICRSFASIQKCQAGQPAELPQFYISATTAVQQLIEHVGQGEYWGNMLDVLLALCDLQENAATAELLAAHSSADQARARVRKAIPLPGFLISGEDYDVVSPFISAIFNEKIGEKTVEDILNGN